MSGETAVGTQKRQESSDRVEESASAERAPGEEAERADQAIAGEISAGLIQRKFAGEVGGESAGALGTEGAGGEVPFRADMEQAFGADFSGVRAYTGRSKEMTALGAKAATRGDDGRVAFADEHPDRETVAHELAHVEQARNTGGASGLSTRSEALSRPGDPAEREADAAAGVVASGGRLAPGSLRTRAEGIQRFGEEQAAGERRSLGESVGRSVASNTPGAYEMLVFLHAVAGGDKAGALAAWEAVPGASRAFLDAPMILAELEAYPPAPADPMMSLPAEESICLPQEKVRYPRSLGADPIASVLRVLGPDSVSVLAGADMLLSEPRHVEVVLQDESNAAAWVAALVAHPGIYITFVLFGLPTAQTVTPEQAKQMAAFADEMDGTYPELLFQRIYPPLHDTSYNSSRVITRAWQPDDVKRMFNGLTDNNIPPAHVHTIARGFYLGTHKVTSDGNESLGYGWYTADDQVVMPTGSSYSGVGDRTHGMSGGGANNAGSRLDHFDSTLLHEVGHGVGDHTDGNSWAKSWGDWKKHSLDDWSSQLFDDSAAQAIADNLVAAGIRKQDVLPPESARRYLAKKVGERDPGNMMSLGERGIMDVRLWEEDDVKDFIKTHYANFDLTKYVARLDADFEVDKGGAYNANADNEGADGRMYTFLSRWGNSHCSYDKKVYDNRISRYSLSSYKEWFAEQYTEYYRTNKTGSTLPRQVKEKLDELDAMKWDSDQERLREPGAADDSTPMKQFTEKEERTEAFQSMFRWWLG